MRRLLEKYGMGGSDQPVGFSGFPMNSQTISAHSWGAFDDGDEELMARFHACQQDFRRWFGDRGGIFQMRIPPLAPDYAWTNQAGAFNLLRTLKTALDPNDIMSPGTFELGEV